MRIPVSVRDIQSKRFTKVAKKLQGRWVHGSLSLMQAQSLLATFLGYRDLHDLQSNLASLIVYDSSQKSMFSRDSVNVSIAWDVSRRHGVGFKPALGMVESLSLKILDFDFLTSDYRTEVFEAEQRKAGRFLIHDEYGYYMHGEQWFEGTPQLLAAGAPNYKFVILPNGRAVRWAKILDEIGRLPGDLAQRLSAEPNYKDFIADFDRVTAFYRDEIIPEISETAAEAIRVGRQLAPGFEIMGYGERALVIYNKAIGGLLPVAYDNHSMKIFEDMATLMTGGVIEHGGDDFIFGSDGMWYQAPRDDGPRVDKDWCMGRFLTSEFSPAVPGVGKVIQERGQDYLRCYEWIDEEYVPAIISDWFDFQPKPTGLSGEAIPAWHAHFQSHVDQVVRAKVALARHNLTGAFTDGRLLSLIHSYAGSTASLEADSLEAIKCYHPMVPGYEPYADPESGEVAQHDDETLEECLREHEEAVDHYREIGREIASAIPGLSNLGELTLGWLYYDSHDNHYDSSDAYLVDRFDIRNSDQVRAFLAFLCLHFHVVATGRPGTEASGNGDSASLQIALDLVLQGICSPAELRAQHMMIGNFIASSRIQAKRIQEIESWRQQMDDQAKIAEGGKYLFAVNAVHWTKPESHLSKMMREGRKYSVAPMMVTQDLSDLSIGDPAGGLSALFANARSLGFNTVSADQEGEGGSG